jgi:hypothetical protein
MQSVRIRKLNAVALFSCLIAGCVCTLAGSSSADKAQVFKPSVSRINKGDRLPRASTPKQSAKISLQGRTARSKLVGCDPAFSPIADPAHAHIVGRCMA